MTSYGDEGGGDGAGGLRGFNRGLPSPLPPKLNTICNTAITDRRITDGYVGMLLHVIIKSGLALRMHV